MTSLPTFLITENDVNLVRQLIDTQFPQYRTASLSYVAMGWDNVMYRLGSHLAVRLPRRAQALTPLAEETRWVNEVTQILTVASPRIEHRGAPSPEFPYPWLIVQWIDGERAMSFSPTQRDESALELGYQLSLLHRASPAEAPVNPFRGVSLQERDHQIAQRLLETAALQPLIPLWNKAVSSTRKPETSYWCHGDLHPGNYVLTPNGALTGIIDFGDLTSGDPAVDLSTAWTSFTSRGREAFLRSYLDHCAPEIAADSGLIDRARGWCIAGFVSPVLISDLSTPDFVRAAHWALEQLGRLNNSATNN